MPLNDVQQAALAALRELLRNFLFAERRYHKVDLDPEAVLADAFDPTFTGGVDLRTWRFSDVLGAIRLQVKAASGRPLKLVLDGQNYQRALGLFEQVVSGVSVPIESAIPVDWALYRRQLVVAAVTGAASARDNGYFIDRDGMLSRQSVDALTANAVAIADAVVAKLRARSS